MPGINEDTLIALDLETTGINAKSDHIIEVGAVKFVGGEQVDTFSALVNPHRRLSSFIVGLTGISQSEVDDAPDWDEIKPAVAEFISEVPIIGHNVGFDASEKEEGFDEPKKDAKKVGKIFPVDITTEFSCGNGVVRDVLSGDEFTFYTITCSDVVDGVSSITQGGQECDVWGDVTGGASAGEDDGGQEKLLSDIFKSTNLNAACFFLNLR